MTHRLRWALAFVVALVSAAGGTMSVSAAQEQPKGFSVTVPMTAHHIVDAVSNGESAQATLDNGQVVPIPQEAYTRWVTTKGQMSPMQTLPGNCGSSTVTFVATGDHQAQMGTSWVVDAATIGFDWKVDFFDSYGSSNQTWGQPFYGPSSWATSFTFTSGGSGAATAQVRTPYSSVTLVTLVVCVSAGPRETTIIF